MSILAKCSSEIWAVIGVDLNNPYITVNQPWVRTDSQSKPFTVNRDGFRDTTSQVIEILRELISAGYIYTPSDSPKNRHSIKNPAFLLLLRKSVGRFEITYQISKDNLG